MIGRGSRLRRRFEHGAAAVEGAIVTLFILAPLLMGTIYFGNYFWQAQRVQTLSLEGIPPESVSGTFTCAQLIARVKAAVAGNVTSLASQLGISPSLIVVGVDVVNVLPVVGADVNVSFEIPLVREASSLLPLPNNGVLVQDLTQRLESVKVTTSSC